MSAYLKHIPSGEVYVFTDVLMKRGDMQPCDVKGNLLRDGVEEVVEVASKPKVTRKAKAKAKAKAQPVEATEPELPNDEVPDLIALDLGDFSSGVDDPE
jgi:hypothetical protein